MDALADERELNNGFLEWQGVSKLIGEDHIDVESSESLV